MHIYVGKYIIVAGSLIPRLFGGRGKKNCLVHTVCACVKYSFHICTSIVLPCVQCTHLSFGSILESVPITHYVIVYRAIYRLVYYVTGLLVHFDACADSVYQAIFFSSPSTRSGDEAKSLVARKLKTHTIQCLVHTSLRYLWIPFLSFPSQYS